MLTAAEPTARAQETRERIAEVAERLFRSMGYQKTAVADIARELGMSPANVYRFFASKSAINEAIAERLLGGMVAELWAIARSKGSAADRLRRLSQHLHERNTALFFQEKRLHDMVIAAMAEHWGVIERYIRDVRGAIRHILLDGMASGEFAPAEPESTTACFKHGLAMFTHPVLLAECIGQGRTDTELAAMRDAQVTFLLRALRP